MTLLQSEDDNACLSFKSSILITLVPATFFLCNGLIVILLKTLEAPIVLYSLLVGAVFITMLTLIWKHCQNSRVNLKRYFPVLAVPFVFAASHTLFFGSSFGGDTASYFTNPVQAFFSTGYFSHSEQPFVEFGKQPLAVYWLPANSEFFFTGIGYFLELDYRQILSLMHFTSNYLIGLVIFVIALRFLRTTDAIVVFIALMLLIYGSNSVRTDFTATSVFRGFENKGLIWGFYFWACINLLIPYGMKPKDNWFLTGSGVLLGISGFLVSGNSIFILLPATHLFLAAVIIRRFRSVVFQFVGLLTAFLLCTIVFKSLETTSVYEVVTSELRFQQPDPYEVQVRSFLFSAWLWLFAGSCALLVGQWSRRWVIYLLTLILMAQFFHSELFFNLFFYLAPQFTINFWRPITLINPFVPFLIAVCLVLSKVSMPSKRFAVSGVILVFILFGYLLDGLNLPKISPFGRATDRPIMSALGKLCPAGSVVLTDRRLGTHLPTVQPNYRYLVGKDVFLNWQIANLPVGSSEREKAENVRNASLYLTRDPVTKKYRDNPLAFEQMLKEQNPVAIFLAKGRISKKNEHLFAEYTKQTYRGVVAFTKQPCRVDFNLLVQQAIDLGG